MKKFNRAELSEMKVAELRALAKENNLVCWIKEEKRKINKPEIVEMLIAHFKMKVDLRKKINLVKSEKVVAVAAPKIATVDYKNFNTVQLMKHFKALCKQALAGYITINSVKQELVFAKQVLHYLTQHKANKLNSRQWALTFNNIKAMINQSRNKIKNHKNIVVAV